MKKIHITLFSAIVLVIVLMTLYGTLTGKKDPLFDMGTKTTFYAEGEAGKEPDIRAEDYFSGDKYDLSKFTFDFSSLNREQEGTYRIPVFYDGRETNCVISMEITGSGERAPEKKEGMSEDTSISN